jgi:SpoVK/Ycf46/Vps4 family AAA+-type ATPase
MMARLGLPSSSSSSSSSPSSQKEIAATPTSTTVTWGDVKGQDEAKQALREAIELPRTYSALYAAYGKRPSKGCLLYGPPGCGKTMLGRTLAQSLGGGEEGFKYVKGGEFQTNTVGDSERKIREAFSAARDYKRRTGIPQVIFFDEADALFPMRTGRKSGSHSYDFMASNMAAILTELDGLQECAAFVILATNRPEVMDPALLRDGRIDRKVRVARPDREVCADILRSGLSKAPGFQEEMVKTAVNEIYNPALCYYIAETEDRCAVRVNFHHQASGALLDGIIERTINEALQRDIAAGRTEPSGLTKEDISKAVEASWRSTLGFDLQWLLEEVAGQQKIASIKTINGRWLGIRSSDAQEIKIKYEIERPDDLLG